jgi:hypothetical protein
MRRGVVLLAVMITACGVRLAWSQDQPGPAKTIEQLASQDRMTRYKAAKSLEKVASLP